MPDVEVRGLAGARRAASGSGPFRAGPALDPSIAWPGCRFLLREALDGALDPATQQDPANRCVALIEPVPQSSRQQELVCLTAAHVSCPRYLRGLRLAGSRAPRSVREPVSPAILGSTLILVAALAASFGFLAVRGGLDLPLRSPAPSLLAGLASVPSTRPTPTPSAVQAASPSVPALRPSPSLGPSASPAPTARPTPRPTARPTPRPTPRPTTPPAPAPTSNRFALLTRCSSGANCWVYVVRSGDNLRSIANYFGVSYNRVLAMNSELGDPTTIRPGVHLRMPTPTR